jgi:hypothetical protein
MEEENSISGFEARKDIIVDSMARSTGASSRKWDCGGELFGEDSSEELVDGTEDSPGGVPAGADGVTVVDNGRARRFR